MSQETKERLEVEDDTKVDNILTIGGNQYKESDLSPEIIASIRHILILQNKNKELSTDFAINQNTIAILENNLKETLKSVPKVPVEPLDPSKCDKTETKV